MQVFVSWSGGKDSCLALFRALKSGFKVRYLFNMLDEDGLKSRGHGLSRALLDAQSEAIGIPIVYGKASWGNYENEFKKIIKSLKGEIRGGVFGDINLEEHREWVERVCGEIGIKAFEVLWNESYEKLLEEFIGEGFEAIIVDVKTELIEGEWVGRPFGREFIEHLGNKGVDLFGEKGEYHTLVTYGPIFKRRIEILETRKIQRNKKLTLEVLKFELA